MVIVITILMHMESIQEVFQTCFSFQTSRVTDFIVVAPVLINPAVSTGHRMTKVLQSQSNSEHIFTL